jgi:S-DNA-T family DNA segregation ATPase FtsK/SpoIIIE
VAVGPGVRPGARPPAQQPPLWDPAQFGEPTGRPEAEDELLEEAIKAVREMKKASISLLQRRLRIGYTRAARLIDVLEEKGVIGPAKPGAQQREVIGAEVDVDPMRRAPATDDSDEPSPDTRTWTSEG